MNWDLAVTGTTASVTLETVGTHVEGRGTGRVAGDSLFLDVAWTFPAQKCSGTLRLHGATANRDTAIVGELSYVDGCTGGQTKPGTFAMWKGTRRETTVGH